MVTHAYQERPWTVHAIVAVSILGSSFSLALDGPDAPFFAGLAIQVILLWGLWMRRGWAYGLLLGLTALGLFGWIFWVLTQYRAIPPAWSSLIALSSVTAIALLRHPLTKRYAAHHGAHTIPTGSNEPLRSSNVAPSRPSSSKRR